MGFLKKIGRTIKKVGKVALPAVAAYYGGRSLLNAFGSVGGATSAAGAAPEAPADGTTLPRVTVQGSSPNWFRENSGALLQGGLSWLGQSQANASNARQAQNQMDFQREMSNTSYQRGTADMEAAGLNPMLAYSQGGASSPGGASATIQDAVTPGITSARAAQTQKLQLENLGLTNDNLAAQNQNIDAQTEYTRAQRNQVISQTVGNDQVMRELNTRIAKMEADGDLTRTQANQLRMMGPEQIQALKLGNQGASYDLSGKKASSDLYDLVGGWGKAFPPVLGGLSSAASAASKLIPMLRK
ncbi:MAG: DNA pilot protein [Microvirus sp.]|nr:MAG: DNA pilot protein [Microvirus sp.]